MPPIDLSEFPWLRRDPSPIVKKSGMFVAPQKPAGLVKPEESFMRSLFFDWLAAQFDNDDVDEFARALAIAGGGKAPKDWDPSKAQNAVERLNVRYDAFKQTAVAPLSKKIKAAQLEDPNLKNVREAMVERSMEQASKDGLPVWFEAAKGLAASRNWKIAIAETVRQFGVISDALSVNGKIPNPKVEEAIGLIGAAYRNFGPKEGELRAAVQRLVELSKQGAGMEVEEASKAVIEAGLEVAQVTEAFADAVTEAAGEIKKFMTTEAKKIYKANLATVAPEVSNALLATKEVTYLATAAIGISAAAFWPLAPLAMAIGIISSVCQKAALEIAARNAVDDEDTMLMLLSTKFEESQFEEAEKQFEHLESLVEYTEKTHTVVETVSHVHEGLEETLKPVLETTGHVLSPIGVTVGGASLMFAFAKGDPVGMDDKWDEKTEKDFKKAVGGCFDLITRKITADATPDCTVDGWNEDHFEVKMFGIDGRLYPDGRFEPKAHQLALAEAVKLAKRRGTNIVALVVDDGPDGRQYGQATATLDLTAFVGDPEWHQNSVSLTVRTPATITLDQYKGFSWTETWEIEIFADYGDVELPPAGVGHRLREMPYMPYADYYAKGHGRDIMTEQLNFNDWSSHPFGEWVTNEEPGLGVTGRMSVKSGCPKEEQEAVRTWLEASGTAQAWRDNYEKTNSYNDSRY